MKLLLFLLFCLFSNLVWAADLYDLNKLFLSNNQPSSSDITPYELTIRTQAANHNFNRGLEEFNNHNYFKSKEYFWNALIETPWDNKCYLWFETVLIKLGEFDYLIRYYDKFGKYNLYQKSINDNKKFITNIFKAEKQYPEYNFTIFKIINGMGIRLRERFFITPSDLLVHDRKLYVVCPTLKQISIFDLNYELLNRISIPGKPLKLTSSDKNVYTFDFDNNKIYQIRNGAVKEINTSNIDFLGIKTIAVDNNENIYVYDSGNKRVVKFKDNKMLLEIGGKNKIGIQFNDVVDIEVDKQNNIFIVDNKHKKIFKIDSSGNLMLSFDYTDFNADVFDIKYRNNNLHILFSDYNLFVVDNMFKPVKEIKISQDDKSHHSFAFDFDQNNNVLISNYYDSIVEVYKDEKFINTPLIINIDKIDYQKFYPLIVKYINVFDIYGNKVYDLDRNHLEVFEGFDLDEDTMLINVTHDLYDMVSKNDDYFVDTEIIEFRKNFIVFPANIRPLNNLLIYDNIDLTVTIINNNSLQNYKSNFYKDFEKFLDSVNFRTTKINLNLISDADNYLLKNSTDKFQMMREIKNAEFTDNYNFYKSLKNILLTKIGGEKNKALVLFADKLNSNLNKNELQDLINFLTINDIPIIVYSFDTDKDKNIDKLIYLTQGKYNSYPDFKYIDDLNYIVERPVNKYVVTYETGYTGLVSNTYLPVYLFINYFGMRGSLLSGYLTSY